jgi:hypothetical protein
MLSSCAGMQFAEPPRFAFYTLFGGCRWLRCLVMGIFSSLEYLLLVLLLYMELALFFLLLAFPMAAAWMVLSPVVCCVVGLISICFCCNFFEKLMGAYLLSGFYITIILVYLLSFVWVLALTIAWFPVCLGVEILSLVVKLPFFLMDCFSRNPARITQVEAGEYAQSFLVSALYPAFRAAPLMGIFTDMGDDD